jgi:hypothetical protein
MKEGFSAYPEIKELAEKVFAPIQVRVTAAMVGNRYEISDYSNGIVLVDGTSQEVRAELNQLLSKK